MPEDVNITRGDRVEQAEDLTRPLARIQKQDLTAQALSRLAHLISTSKPGSRLPTERELCEMLGIGRSTLREVMRTLDFIGAVQVRQGAGTFVAETGEGGVEKLISIGLVLERCKVGEIAEFRRMLEVQTVRLAAVHHQAADREALERVMALFASAVDSPSEASRYDLEYHVLLARASYNSVLRYFLDGIRPLLEIWINRAVNRREVIQAVCAEHEDILKAVFARDPEQAAARMFIHQTNAADRLYSVLGRDHSAGCYLSELMERTSKNLAASQTDST